MKKEIYRIESIAAVAADIFRMELSGEDTAMHSGQFVDIAVEGLYLRRPISVSDSSDGRLAIIFKVVGEGTRRLSLMSAGQSLELLTGLGHGFTVESCVESALIVGGGLGAAPMYLLCRELLAAGKRVTAVLGFNSAEDAFLVDDLRALGVEVTVSTVDGSLGVKGFVTDAIALTAPSFDFFYSCGPMPMQRALCAAIRQPGEVSLEERMGCGAGFCYGCTIVTAAGPKRVCKDGPVFRKEDIIW